MSWIMMMVSPLFTCSQIKHSLPMVCLFLGNNFNTRIIYLSRFNIKCCENIDFREGKNSWNVHHKWKCHANPIFITVYINQSYTRWILSQKDSQSIAIGIKSIRMLCGENIPQFDLLNWCESIHCRRENKCVTNFRKSLGKKVIAKLSPKKPNEKHFGVIETCVTHRMSKLSFVDWQSFLMLRWRKRTPTRSK